MWNGDMAGTFVRSQFCDAGSDDCLIQQEKPPLTPQLGQAVFSCLDVNNCFKQGAALDWATVPKESWSHTALLLCLSYHAQFIRSSAKFDPKIKHRKPLPLGRG